jgi:hypothetical protein
LRTDCAPIAQRLHYRVGLQFYSDAQRLLSDCVVFAHRLRSVCAAFAQHLHVDYKVISKRLRCISAPFAHRFNSHCTIELHCNFIAIAHLFLRDCSVFAKRLRSVCAAFAQQLRSVWYLDYKAISKRLRSDCAPIEQRLHYRVALQFHSDSPFIAPRLSRVCATCAQRFARGIQSDFCNFIAMLSDCSAIV